VRFQEFFEQQGPQQVFRQVLPPESSRTRQVLYRRADLEGWVARWNKKFGGVMSAGSEGQRGISRGG
jgi:hypothetical protein